MMIRVTLAVTLILIAVTGTAHAAQPGPALNAGQIEQLIAGNTLHSETRLARFEREEVRTFTIYVKADGTLTIRNFEGNIDTGEWEIAAQGEFCNQYRQTRRGMRKCYQVLDAGDHYQLLDLDNSQVTSVFTVSAGNPERLP